MSSTFNKIFNALSICLNNYFCPWSWFWGQKFLSIANKVKYFWIKWLYADPREGGVTSWLRRGLTWLRVRATRGAFLCLQIYFCCLPCRVPCPNGIKLQSLGVVRFRNWCREVGKMAIATTSSSKLSDHRKGHVAIGNTPQQLADNFWIFMTVA